VVNDVPCLRLRVLSVATWAKGYHAYGHVVCLASPLFQLLAVLLSQVVQHAEVCGSVIAKHFTWAGFVPNLGGDSHCILAVLCGHLECTGSLSRLADSDWLSCRLKLVELQVNWWWWGGGMHTSAWAEAWVQHTPLLL